MSDKIKMVSIIIPTFNGEKRVGNTIDSLINQDYKNDFEIIIVNDGSKDDTLKFLEKYKEKNDNIRILNQNNAGPAAARNNGAKNALGDIILFTDDDCIAEKDWLQNMIRPFEDESLIGAKGAYKCNQKELTAKFVQIEYEHKYEKLKKYNTIDTIDTYSAAFRKKEFLELGGYDITFPVACAEDFEFSYRMSAKGYKMIFIPEAFVYHTHPNYFLWYMKKKYKFAYWRWLAIKKNPEKLKNDTHTPQTMKLNALLSPFLFLSGVLPFFIKKTIFFAYLCLCLFGLFSLDFMIFILKKNFLLFILSPLYIYGRALSQFLGIFNGFKDIFIFKKYD